MTDVKVLRQHADLVALDYETMMREARIALANSRKPHIMAIASILAEQIALNPEFRMNWDAFLELNR